MLGTGTQLDPYQITTVAEFRSMNDETAYFKLMNDLDVNDSEWASGWTSVTLRFKEFDGDGREIRNINYSGTGDAITISTAAPTIKNLDFVNFISVGSSSCFNKNSSGTMTFNSCTFSFAVSTTRIFTHHINLNFVNFNQCSFLISGDITGFVPTSYLNGYGTINNSHIKFTDFAFRSTTSRVALINLNATRASICGSIANDVSGTTGWFSQASQCFIAVDMVGKTTYPTYFSRAAPTSPCFYDKDLMGVEMAAQTNVHALTTAQCKDKDYLNSIGFLVV